MTSGSRVPLSMGGGGGRAIHAVLATSSNWSSTRNVSRMVGASRSGSSAAAATDFVTAAHSPSPTTACRVSPIVSRMPPRPVCHRREVAAVGGGGADRVRDQVALGRAGRVHGVAQLGGEQRVERARGSRGQERADRDDDDHRDRRAGARHELPAQQADGRERGCPAHASTSRPVAPTAARRTRAPATTTIALRPRPRPRAGSTANGTTSIEMPDTSAGGASSTAARARSPIVSAETRSPPSTPAIAANSEHGPEFDAARTRLLRVAEPDRLEHRHLGAALAIERGDGGGDRGGREQQPADRRRPAARR